jgi:hypothetical protein
MVRKKMWVFSPPRKPKPKVPESIKAEVQARANHLIESDLKPQHVKPPPTHQRFNYIVDIYSKRYQSYFHFYAKYRCPAPNCITEFFETKFARLEYVGEDRFNLSYMRYTGQWWELYKDLSLEKCLEEIKHDPHFMP